MIKEIIDYIKEISYKHISVDNTRYIKSDNVNDQPNIDGFQVIIENDSPLIEYQLVEGILTMNLDIDILGFVSSDTTVIEIQDEATHIALDIIEYITNDNTQIDIRDYSLLSLTEYTDNNCSGARLSLKLVLPNPINICEYKDHFIDKPHEEKKIMDLSPTDECTKSKPTTKIKLNPIKL